MSTKTYHNSCTARAVELLKDEMAEIKECSIAETKLLNHEIQRLKDEWEADKLENHILRHDKNGLEQEIQRLKELINKLWQQTFYTMPVPENTGAQAYAELFDKAWQQFCKTNNI